jgi:hypothetical protein
MHVMVLLIVDPIVSAWRESVDITLASTRFIPHCCAIIMETKNHSEEKYFEAFEEEEEGNKEICLLSKSS